MYITAKQKKIDTPNWAIFLRQARKQKGLTLEEVAQKIGVSFMAMSHYELGRREPKIERFEKWLKVFGLKLVVEEEKK